MKIKFLLFTFLLGFSPIWSIAPTISKSGGWFETAFIEWQPVSGADSYNVYYSLNGANETKIDNPLIRYYGPHFRADIPGLKTGSYNLKVIPVISGSEGDAATVTNVSVTAHDRTGFAFANNRVPGAYNSDGTPKNGAVILYITENTKNTVQLTVTGASTNPCVGLQEILDGFKKGKDNRPLIIRVVGQITDLTNMQSGDIVIENSNNASGYITLEGIGEDATADGWGIRLKNASNIEVRNLGIMNVNSGEGDNLGLQQNNDYVWVHNIDFFYGDAGGDADQAKGDGALDCKKSTYVTFSYNHFWDTGKSNLLGLSEGTTQGLYITYHHNWYDHSDSRHPRVRYYSAHVYNNYYDGNAKYGIGSTLGSSVFSEGNYFRNAKYPMLTSMQGTDVWDASNDKLDESLATFSSENGGTIKAFNNYIEGAKRFAPYNDANYTDSKVNFDAYVASTRNEKVPSSITSRKGTNTYNNFDTDNNVMYSYTAQSPANAKTTVMQFAGRLNGGDFTWAFINSQDDESYSVNTGLKAKLVGYKTTLDFIQGEDGSVIITSSSSQTSSSSVIPQSSSSIVSSSSSVPQSSSSDVSSSSTTAISGDIIHNFTSDGTQSAFFSITGNLSTSKGTVDYAGLTLSQCLKLESATSILFTLSDAASITLVLNSDFNGDILVDNTSYVVTNGMATIELTAGAHEITKGGTSNLYLISIKYSGDIVTNHNKISTKFPNLVFDNKNNLVHFSTQDQISTVEIYNLMGSLVFKGSISQNTLNISQLKSGSYVIRAIGPLASLNQLIHKH